MKKEAFYFPHFCHARHDRKIKRILKEFGIEGYGIYFMLLEVLREQTDFQYPLSEIDLLADEFGTSEQKVKVVILNYNLFEIDENNNFFSLKLIEFMQPYIKMKEQRSIAGKASAEKRKQIIQRPFNDRSTTVQQSKVKESKVNKIKEKEIKLEENYYRKFKHLKLSFSDFEKLKEQGFSEDSIKNVLDSIENYSKNTKYTSLYLTALKWLKNEKNKDSENPLMNAINNMY